MKPGLVVFFENFKHIRAVTVTKGIKPMPIQEGEYQGNPNPHAWMSAQNALIYIENIWAALVKYDPKMQIFITKMRKSIC
ncbi:putative periplasmic iron-binding protein [Arsenophonus endosymbiont of Bemisia tabaci Q2]|nr:putative periplasmic iron-binding protein [Arsenophonus endosymbiont of Bemisia tabaci Q2]